MATDFENDYEWTMEDEDPTEAHKIVPDAPNLYKMDANNQPVLDASGNKIRIGAFAISGVNSAAYPAEYAAIAALPQDQRGPAVENFYRKNFFNSYEAALVDEVEKRIFNHMVNRGPVPGVRVLQNAVNTLGGKLVVDGRWGPATVAAANACDTGLLVTAVKACRLQDYKNIVARNPAQAKYLGTADKPGVWWIRAMK